jgi:hypothetical protein
LRCWPNKGSETGIVGATIGSIDGCRKPARGKVLEILERVIDEGQKNEEKWDW